MGQRISFMNLTPEWELTAPQWAKSPGPGQGQSSQEGPVHRRLGAQAMPALKGSPNHKRQFHSLHTVGQR